VVAAENWSVFVVLVAPSSYGLVCVYVSVVDVRNVMVSILAPVVGRLVPKAVYLADDEPTLLVVVVPH